MIYPCPLRATCCTLRLLHLLDLYEDREVVRDSHIARCCIMRVLELHDSTTNNEVLICVCVDQYVIVVLVSTSSCRVFGYLANKSITLHLVPVVARVRVKVSTDDVYGRCPSFPVWCERQLHAALGRVGCGVVTQQRCDLTITRIVSVRWRQVYACNYKVAVCLHLKPLVV